tara:strand:- start:4570 stop:4845 length:276 start_codon:yes stop_codon:yes gene_type:complete
MQKKPRREIIYRTKEERQTEIKEVLKQLSHFELTPRYEPVKKLYILIRKYIDDGDRIEINIPFPMINRRIKGLLAVSVNEQVWIKLQNELF